MNIYLCAQFKEQELMREWRRLLHNAGHIVTSRWLDADGEKTETNAASLAADMDLEDIDIATVVITHTLNRGDLFTGGGRHIEYGYALHAGKILINIGGVESVFHSKAGYHNSIEDCIKWLARASENIKS